MKKKSMHTKRRASKRSFLFLLFLFNCVLLANDFMTMLQHSIPPFKTISPACLLPREAPEQQNNNRHWTTLHTYAPQRTGHFFDFHLSQRFVLFSLFAFEYILCITDTPEEVFTPELASLRWNHWRTLQKREPVPENALLGRFVEKCSRVLEKEGIGKLK